MGMSVLIFISYIQYQYLLYLLYPITISYLFIICSLIFLILVEWSTTNGELVALAAKSYMGFDYDTGVSKRATKGIPHSIQMQLQHFRDVLYQTNEDRHIVDINSLRLNKEKIMCRTNCVKQGLSDIFIKLAVDSDKITCLPLKVKQELI